MAGRPATFRIWSLIGPLRGHAMDPLATDPSLSKRGLHGRSELSVARVEQVAQARRDSSAYGASKTRREFRELLAELSELAGTELTELRGQALFRGSGARAGAGHADRDGGTTARPGVLEERGHKVVASGRWSHPASSTRG
jgi:hypothetical protein